MRHVIIVGGGITGLTAAFTLERQAEAAGVPVSYTLLEASSRLGGKILTEQAGEFLVEGGPDSFVATKAAALALFKALGLDDQLIGQSTHGTYVVRNGTLHSLPVGMGLLAPTNMDAFRGTALFTEAEKEQLLAEQNVPPRTSDEDESLASFVRRRFGQAAVSILAEPLYAGVHVADAERLSVKTCFPQFHDMERKYGTLTKAAQTIYGSAASKGGAGQIPFLTPRGGMGVLASALVERLHGTVRLGEQAVRVRPTAGGRVRVETASGASIEGDAVILAVLPSVAAKMMAEWKPELAESLRGIRAVTSATVSLAYRRSDVSNPLNGTGFIIPRSEPYHLFACTWSSSKFQGRSPDGKVLMRVFISEWCYPGLAEEDPKVLASTVKKELRGLLGITGEPQMERVFVWKNAHPQYDVGHQDRLRAISAACPQNIVLAGAGYRGSGVPDCIAQGTAAAEAVLGVQERSGAAKG